MYEVRTEQSYESMHEPTTVAFPVFTLQYIPQPQSVDNMFLGNMDQP